MQPNDEPVATKAGSEFEPCEYCRRGMRTHPIEMHSLLSYYVQLIASLEANARGPGEGEVRDDIAEGDHE